MKRLISVFMSVLLVVSLVPYEISPQARDGEPSGSIFQELLAFGESPGSLAASSANLSAGTLDTQQEGDSEHATATDAQRAGIGGGGALFDPAVSPFDANDMAVGTDMGDLYVTRDGGASWSKKATGRVYDIQYDPTRKGTVYACGSGIWRSTDHGESFELMWPKSGHVTGEPTKYEQTRHYFFNTDGYDPYSQIVSIAVDRANNQNIYALAAKSSDFILYRSTDGGDTFAEIARHAQDMRGITDRYDNSKLVVNDGVCWLCTQVGIFAYTGVSTLAPVYEPDGVTHYSVVDVAQVIDDGSHGVSAGTYYWIAEGLESGKERPVTSLRRFTVGADGQLAFDDLTADMNDQNKGLNRIIWGNADKQTAIHILGLAAPSATRLYFYTQVTNDYNNTILARYDASLDKPFAWVFGYQLNNSTPALSDAPGRLDLQNLSHADSYTVMYGIAASPAAPNRFLLSTGFGLYGSPDCEDVKVSRGNWYPRRSNVYQLYSNLHPSASVPGHVNGYKYTYSSTGIDTVTTYGLRADPFDSGHVALLNADLGLTLSNDSGTTWSRSRTMNNGMSDDDQRKLPDAWNNTAYDLAFDRYKKGRVYSLWSGRHDAPYSTSPESDKKANGGFAVADIDDAGWEALTVGWSKADGSKLSSKAGEAALPANSIPVRLGVVYPSDSAKRQAGTDRTLWVACFGGGFYRSTDSGSTFEAVNDGISETTDDMIYAADLEVTEDGSRVFGMTALRTDKSISGKVYQWDAGGQAWSEIPLPAGVTCPRDISWDERTQTLYISCVAGNTWIGGDGIQPNFKNTGGGLFTWHPGDATASAYDAASEILGDACSVEGAVTDSAGNLFVSDVRGNVFLKRAGEGAFEKIYDGFHVASKNVQIVDEQVGSNGTRVDTLSLASLGGGQLCLSVQLLSDEGPDPGSDEDSDLVALASVRVAAEASVVYSREQEFGSTALKDVFETKLPGSQCFSVGEGEYHVLYNGGYFSFTVNDGAVGSAAGVARGNQLPVYDTLADARAAVVTDWPAAFLTRGLNAVGDKGDGYYAKVDALATGQPGFTARRLAYALTSGESAVNVYQLGYTAGTESVNDAIETFHASAFHTLVFPKGDYRITKEVWSCYDDRSYYGLDATLYTDGEVALGRNLSHKSLWVIRGSFAYGSGTETYVNDQGETVKKDVAHAVRNVELNGLRFERRTGTLGYNRFLSLRSARNVTFNQCVFDGITADDAMPVSGDTMASPGAAIDFYGDYDNVRFLNSTIVAEAAIDIRDLCDHVDNIGKNLQVDADYPTGGRNVVVRDNNITVCNFDEGLPIFAGNQQGLGSWKDGVFTEYPALTHCLVQDVLVENNTYTMLEPQTNKQRVVSITCGYQDSPVERAIIRNNTFDVRANSYLMLFGYATDCQFANNKVALRRTASTGQIHELIHRSDLSRTGPTKNVVVSGNRITVKDEATTVARMVDIGFGPEALSFTNNDVTVEGKTELVLDSAATSTDNTFHLNKVTRLYGRVGEVANNTYEINELYNLYQSYGTNATTDINIHDEKATIGEMTSKYLFTFNGTPSYNGHSITLADCAYEIEKNNAEPLRVAYSADSIVDSLSLNFDGCDISGVDGPQNYTIAQGASKVNIQVSGSRKSRDSVAVMVADTELAAGDVVVTTAYYAGGASGVASAGKGIYDIKTMSDVAFENAPKAIDGGRYIALGNGLVAVLRTPADAVDLYQYGARGDGATDDSARIQAAFDSGLATVRVSAGTYVCAGAVIPSGTSVVGAGRDACAFVSPLGEGGYGTAGPLGIASGAHDVTLRGVTVDGRRDVYKKTGVSKDAAAPELSGDAAHFIYDAGGAGNYTLLGWLGGAEDISVEGCRFKNNNSEAVKFVGGKDVSFTDCEFFDVDCGIITQGGGKEGNVTGLTVDGCMFDGHWFSEPISMFAEGSHYERLVFTNNTFKNKPAGSAILLYSDDGERKNTFHDVTISGNSVQRCSGGLSLYAVDGATIANNDLGGSAARLYGCSNMTFEGLVFKDCLQSALVLRDCTNVKVSGLDVDGFGVDSQIFPAISVGDAAGGQNTGCSISGTVKGAASSDGSWRSAVIATAGGVDLSGITFDLGSNVHALFVNAGVTGLVYHTAQDVSIYDGSGTLGNDIVVEHEATFSGGAGLDNWNRTHNTGYTLDWITYESEILTRMQACQDGFTRTLAVNAVNSDAVLADGDGSQGSITWLDGGHTVAKGASATYKLVCQDGVWHEVRVEELPDDDPKDGSGDDSKSEPEPGNDPKPGDAGGPGNGDGGSDAGKPDASDGGVGKPGADAGGDVPPADGGDAGGFPEPGGSVGAPKEDGPPEPGGSGGVPEKGDTTEGSATEEPGSSALAPAPSTSPAAASVSSRVAVRPVYCVANRKNGERLYLVGARKVLSLDRGKWRYEGVAFYAPAKGGKPVYRLVNEETGRNLYSVSKSRKGWKNKGRAFYAMKSGGVKVYRMRHKQTGAYILAKKPAEVKRLKKLGYRKKATAFRAFA